MPAPAGAPTLYFIGVSTARSSIRTVFPQWAARLGLREARLEGIDLPLHAPREHYRDVVDFIAADPLGLGALVTTHKIDLFRACRDRFDVVDPLAQLTGEVSCLSKRGGQLVCHAKDPVSSGLALQALLPPRHFERTGAEAFLIGAGGSATAISWYLTRPHHGADRPSRVIVSDRDPERLQSLRALHARLAGDVPIETVHATGATDNDDVLAGLSPGALVVNASGLGKDAPGSPLSAAARFPRSAIAWDLNYRGELVFLEQARAAGHVQAVDGWVYFLHGWTRVIAEVFDIDIPTSGPQFEALEEIAAGTRR
ncbi:shikimate dehydrogenase family protein [Kineococcus sp. SYSU DK005]|uniref:shikimate dehydrogenase family protein n=1 Tax=Kineococcus sp. SYSU DK005 TaxID=3383126 RepID=UPI003D7F17D8